RWPDAIRGASRRRRDGPNVWGLGGHVGAPKPDAPRGASRRRRGGPNVWGLGGHGGAPMNIGINLATAADSWKVVKRAEELGYARAWFYDTQLLNADMFVAMGAAAVQTSRIRLATGVLIPSNRIAPVAASALASLNALAPGRVDFGISTG